VSADYREAVLRDALKLGVPCVRRVGRVVALCTAVRKRIDGVYEGDCRAWEAPSAGFAKQFVERAVAESSWKCAQRLDAPAGKLFDLEPELVREILPAQGGAA